MLAQHLEYNVRLHSSHCSANLLFSQLPLSGRARNRTPQAHAHALVRTHTKNNFLFGRGYCRCRSNSYGLKKCTSLKMTMQLLRTYKMCKLAAANQHKYLAQKAKNGQLYAATIHQHPFSKVSIASCGPAIISVVDFTRNTLLYMYICFHFDRCYNGKHMLTYTYAPTH